MDQTFRRRPDTLRVKLGLHDSMARRSGSAILPLHGGRVPPWLATRMSSLGAIITQAIVHHYGRDEFLQRLSHPFWFQSFGAVMGMDWHSSGITTSVIGALKRGLAPLSDELGIHVCGGRGQHSRKTPDELQALGERIGFDGARLTRASRLVAKVDSAAVQDGFDLYLHGFFVTDDGKWTVVQQGMNGDRKQARRYHWHSEDLKSFVDEPHSAIDGPAQGEIVNLTDKRAETSRAAQLELVTDFGPDRIVSELAALSGEAPAQASLPHLIMPAHPRRPIQRRLHAAAAWHPRCGSRAWPHRLPGTAADAGRRGAHGAVARDGRRGRSRGTLPLSGSGPLLAGPRRKRPPSLPSSPQGLRRDHPGHEISSAQGKART
jgi:hypothetical protein